MATVLHSQATAVAETNGAAMAAVLGAGIGSAAMGVFVLLNEAGVFAAPALYGPAGGVTGRTTFATIAWLIAWGVLHARWKSRDVAPGPVFSATAILVVLAIIGTFPPVWGLLQSSVLHPAGVLGAKGWWRGRWPVARLERRCQRLQLEDDRRAGP